jgi:non-ribosomal peptide synthetase component F
MTVERKQHELDEEVAGFEAELAEVFAVHYERMLRSMHLLLAAALDLDNFVLDDPAARRILLESGARAVDVNETTQRAIARAIADGQMAGETTLQLADRIRHLFEVTWRGRAEMVARTEIQQAQLLASYDRYRASGVVQRIMIHDGGTGDSDAFCNARNGRVVPLSQPVSLAHPRCTLSISPVVEPLL